MCVRERERERERKRECVCVSEKENALVSECAREGESKRDSQ